MTTGSSGVAGMGGATVAVSAPRAWGRQGAVAIGASCDFRAL
jgi:hypothetical protein